MDVRGAIKEQYHGGLAMLRQCIERCPNDLWRTEFPCPQDDDRTIVRTFGRIAFHTVYFTHLYLGQDEESCQPWPGRRAGWHEELWRIPWKVEPYELPEDADFEPKEILNFLDFLDGIVDATVDGLDLDSESTGIPWYENMSKLSHELMNIRHLQGHVGQLSEILMARGIDIHWIAKR